MNILKLQGRFKKAVISTLAGFILLCTTWFFTNNEYTFDFEDTFFSKIYLWKFKVLEVKPEIKRNFIFINTGKDIALAEDTLDYGSIAIADREKLYRLIRYINQAPGKPLYTFLDLQFYHKNSSDPTIDTLLMNEVSLNNNIVIPVLKNENGQYIKPFINTNYALADYTTFGNGFSKFKLFTENELSSIPVFLHQKLDHAIYKDNLILPECNKHLCLSSIWPSFYLNISDVSNNKCSYSEYYNLGEILLGFEGDTTMYLHFFENKIIILGNFDTDVHNTPIGISPGSLILANVYLSLLNGQHLVSYVWLFLLWLILSIMSYFACFGELPKLNLKFSFIFSKELVSFFQNYFSYMGYLLLFSLISIFVFNLQVDLILPSLLLTFLEYFSHKKHKAS